jgi:CRP-like cAMP-binding protein
MALDEDVRVLSRVSLFEGFTQEQLRLLAFGAEPMRLAARKYVYREGDQADSAFLVIEGTVELIREQEGRRRVVGNAQSGTLLGELALIADTNRATDAATATDARLMRLGRQQFRRILEEFPELAGLLHDRIVEQLQRMVSDIERVGRRFSN